MPLSRAVEILGRRITPSGWKKNLNRSPGLIRSRSRTALGIVTCPLLLSVASIARSSLYILSEVKKFHAESIPALEAESRPSRPNRDERVCGYSDQLARS